jgi:hypothetical protein
MARLHIIRSGDAVTAVLPGETSAMTFEGLGLEEGDDTPVVVLCPNERERITYPLAELRIEPDEDD